MVALNTFPGPVSAEVSNAIGSSTAVDSETRAISLRLSAVRSGSHKLLDPRCTSIATNSRLNYSVRPVVGQSVEAQIVFSNQIGT